MKNTDREIYREKNIKQVIFRREKNRNNVIFPLREILREKNISYNSYISLPSLRSSRMGVSSRASAIARRLLPLSIQ